MKIGIVGAGTMGIGIAQAFAQQDGFEVKLNDIKLEFAQRGIANIEKKLTKLVEKQKIEEPAKKALLARIEAVERSGLKDCDVIIEAALENMESKKALFAELQNICKKDAIFATNTSSLSITEIGQGLNRPVIGMHFFNPAEIMKLVEIISGLHTTPAMVETIKQLSIKIGKTPVEVQEAPGFVVNRILVPMINEAVGLLADRVASAEDIDTAMKLGANHPMGPLALGDLIGLDICLAIMEVLQAETGEDKYRPHPYLRKMVRAGQLGRKTGKGFFDYSK
ncbi:MAG: 3-hydroxyacyl-CoA dehydrogenase NAD-binding domain-containing protein [Saezia sp.]